MLLKLHDNQCQQQQQQIHHHYRYIQNSRRIRKKIVLSSNIIVILIPIVLLLLLHNICMIRLQQQQQQSKVVVTSSFVSLAYTIRPIIKGTSTKSLLLQQQQRSLLSSFRSTIIVSSSSSSLLPRRRHISSSSITTTTTMMMMNRETSNNYIDNDHHDTSTSTTSNTSIERTNQSLSSSTSYMTKTNRELAEERIQVYRAKRIARQQSIQKSNERNYQLKQLLYGQNNNSNMNSSNNDDDTIQDETMHQQSMNGDDNDDTTSIIIPTQRHTTPPSSSSSSYMYQLKVLVCEELRIELKLSGREKRGRIFIDPIIQQDAMSSISAFRHELHAFFRALQKDSYLLYGGYPIILHDGTIIASITNHDNITNHTINDNQNTNNNNNNHNTTIWPIINDDDVIMTFQRANDLYESYSSTGLLKRPAIVIHVKKNPNRKPPPPKPLYLMNMSDPTTSTHMSMLSFYSFPINGISDPNTYAITLRKLFKPFHALGRIYVAQEGVNAQMSVPTNVIHNFQNCCHHLPNGVGTYIVQNGGINIDPKPLSRAEFAIAGIPAAATAVPSPTSMNDTTSDDTIIQQPTPPFTNLHIRVRQQIVADGFDKEYDWQHAGYDMPALEWHQKLKEEKERRERGDNDDDTGIRLLDCRNIYETDVGRFENAEPLETHTFRDSWDALKERLADTPKDAPIMTYCTGGIRCVKVGAYLTQELGFTNVSRLAGGIIAYDRTLSEHAPNEIPMFKGTNFVFDGRLGRPITEDALGSCTTCGSETSAISNCRNENCHKRIIQCESCRTTYSGTCSDACRQRIVNGAMRYRRNSISDDSSTNMNPSSNRTTVSKYTSYKTLDDYSQGHSSPLPSIYPEMEHNTRALIPSGTHMVSGSAQGKLLTHFASMTREGRILEIGTFTGYGTACLLEGAGLSGRTIGITELGSRESGPYVLSMERDAKAYDVAVSQLKVIAELGIGEAAAEALCGIRGNNQIITNVSDTATVSYEYDDIVTCELLKVSDALAIVEEMAAGRGDFQPAPFDMVFLDADKTRLLEYTEALLCSDRVLKHGGLIVVDNVLWKGLVLEACSGDFSSLQEFADSEEAELRKNRRARKLANKMHRFNSEIVKDNRVDVLVLPMRDGLSVIRKK